MAATLGLQGMTDADFNQGNGKLLALLQHPGNGVTLSIANALWGRKGTTFNAGFLQRNAVNFQASIRGLNFFSPTTAATAINQWVKGKTQGMIPALVTADDVHNALLLLTNALYFKGQWTEKFDRAQTHDGPFTLTGGTKKTVPMMHNLSTWDYLETDTFQAISLPYGTKRLVSLFILLPKPGVTLDACAASVTSANWRQWMLQFQAQEVKLTLPRFTADYSTRLRDTLTALGMGIAFSNRADFSGMLPASAALDNNPYIKNVIHKTALKVDEEGTVAAAATAVTMMAAGAGSIQKPPITFTVDHPFLIAIRDQSTGALLFWGSIANP
jgi:serpin B